MDDVLVVIVAFQVVIAAVAFGSWKQSFAAGLFVLTALLLAADLAFALIQAVKR